MEIAWRFFEIKIGWSDLQGPIDYWWKILSVPLQDIFCEMASKPRINWQQMGKSDIV